MKRHITISAKVTAISIVVCVLAAACGMKFEWDNDVHRARTKEADTGISDKTDHKGNQVSAILVVIP